MRPMRRRRANSNILPQRPGEIAVSSWELKECSAIAWTLRPGGSFLVLSNPELARLLTITPLREHHRAVLKSSLRAVSSVGRALRLHRRGRRFESVTAHQPSPKGRRLPRRSSTGAKAGISGQHGLQAPYFRQRPVGGKLTNSANEAGASRAEESCAPRCTSNSKNVTVMLGLIHRRCHIEGKRIITA